MLSSSNSASGHLTGRQAALVCMNVTWLRQALAFLGRIDDVTYASSPKALEPHRVGSHLRHIVEFYECFLNGVDSAHIDYDARKRDGTIATSRAAAAARIQQLIEQLQTAPLLRGDSLVWVRIEDAEPASSADPYVTSSIGRELQSLSSHTIHHFALIAMTLKAHGVEVDPDFGTAPSTLRYQASQSSSKAA